MISLKAFVDAIHEAILSASDSLMDKNVGLLDKYFDESPANAPPGTKTVLVPKTVILEYPNYSQTGDLEISEVQVPLITLVPLTMSKVEKAVVTTELELDLVDGELQVNLASKPRTGILQNRPNPKVCRVEITLSPQEPPEGIKILIEGYDAVLKRQIT